jgi:acetylornithine deacetylase/succinyl-diaminopimelate desuccinylase-like protein
VSAAASLRDEAVELLRALIRLDTVNPPGNETIAAELLRDYLAESGVEAELIARERDRANLVARVAGRGAGPRLALLSHTDTVLADAEEWQVDPWSAELRDGEIWGRGALDMKGQVAAAAVTLASLAREGFRPNGDLVFIAAADEEVGVDVGLQWLAREHPEAVRAEYVVNEGGGDRVVFGGRPFYLCSVAEKMTAPFRLRVRGRSGHASMPGIADNALLKAARLVTRLGDHRPEPAHTPETEALFEAVGVTVPRAADAAEVAEGIHPLARALVEPLLSVTLAPTMIEASSKRNVIPAVCEVVVDCRLQPGRQPEDVEPAIRELLGEEDYELTWIERWGGTRSPAVGPLWEAVRGFVSSIEPAAGVIALGAAGFTDSHWLREAFGTVAYGFFPMRTMEPEVAALLVHSADERVHVDDLALGLDFLRHAAQAIGSARS